MDVTRQVVQMFSLTTSSQENNIVSANKVIVEIYIASDVLLKLFWEDN